MESLPLAHKTARRRMPRLSAAESHPADLGTTVSRHRFAEGASVSAAVQLTAAPDDR
jgi:hypothetical protein